MSEIERTYEDVEVIPDVSWEELVSEWTAGASQALIGQLRQARTAAAVSRHFGRASMEAFAKEVGASRSTVYDYCRVWQVYGHLFEDGHELSGRLDNSPLSISHFVEASYAPDPIETLARAEDEGLTTRQIKAERQLEEPKGVEHVETIVCPTCHGSGEIPKD